MPVNTRPYDLANHLNTPERIEAYLNAVMEDGDPEEIAEALQAVGRARKQAVVASISSITRANLDAVEAISRELGHIGYRLKIAAA